MLLSHRAHGLLSCENNQTVTAVRGRRDNGTRNNTIPYKFILAFEVIHQINGQYLAAIVNTTYIFHPPPYH